MHRGSQKGKTMAKAFLQALIIIAIFCATVYGVNEIAEKGREVTVYGVTAQRFLTAAACIAIAIITVGFDVIGLIIFLRVM